MTQVVIKVIGNYSYQTSKCLGQGVYGKVYQGMQRQTKQKVAIKKIDLATFTNDKYLQNAIFSQIYLLKRFNHFNIVKFKDVLSSKNSLYIITQFCKNGDLKQLIKRKKFKQQQAFQIMYQIMNGFSQLIRQKIVHRDLKPANILINQGIYKIGDFGFAKYVDNFGSQMLKSCVGSPIYMAPQILQRAQYTTKCDIWSLGIIFYEMLFGYPPWKARDQSQLLRGIKTIPISHILKRNSNNLSGKATQFLKRTLAYSEEQRIGWGQLFELFNQKSETKSIQQIQRMYQGVQKQRTRLVSTGSNWNSNTPNTSSQGIINQSTTPPQVPTSLNNINHTSNHNTNNINNINNINSTSSPNNINSTSNLNNISPVSNTSNPSNLTPSNKGSQSSPVSKLPSTSMKTVISPSQNISLTSQRRSVYQNPNLQIQNVLQMRQFCIYYHFYTVQLFVSLTVVRNQLSSVDAYCQLLLVLAMMVKYKSTYCLSLVSIHHKNDKKLQQLYKKMKAQHDAYQMIFNQISNKLDQQNIGKNVRNEIYNHIGRSQIINQEKNQKLQNIVIRHANQNAQLISQQVRKKAKTLKEIKIVQILNYILQVLSLGMGRSKALKDLKQAPRMQQQDLKDYISRVISKLDRIATNS